MQCKKTTVDLQVVSYFIKTCSNNHAHYSTNRSTDSSRGSNRSLGEQCLIYQYLMDCSILSGCDSRQLSWYMCKYECCKKYSPILSNYEWASNCYLNLCNWCRSGTYLHVLFVSKIYSSDKCILWIWWHSMIQSCACAVIIEDNVHVGNNSAASLCF